MFLSLAARETCVAETNFAARKTKNVFAMESKTFLLPGHKFFVQSMFPSLATPGNITRNIVSATMFPSLAKPLVTRLVVVPHQHLHQHTLTVCSSHLSKVRDLTLDTCTPKLRWIPEHSMQTRIPRLMLAQSGPTRKK